MGMAASQARYLALVARKSNCEFEGQQINQARLTLANESASLFNQMLGLTVPVPPSSTDYMTTQYTYSDGNRTYVIDSWKQLSTDDPDYNYIVNTHYYTDIYTGSIKQMADPQVQLSNPGGEIASLTEIESTLAELRAAETQMNIKYNAWQTIKTEQEAIIADLKSQAQASAIHKHTLDDGIHTSVPSVEPQWQQYILTGADDTYTVKIFNQGNNIPNDAQTVLSELYNMVELGVTSISEINDKMSHWLINPPANTISDIEDLKYDPAVGYTAIQKDVLKTYGLAEKDGSSDKFVVLAEEISGINEALQEPDVTAILRGYQIAGDANFKPTSWYTDQITTANGIMRDAKQAYTDSLTLYNEKLDLYNSLTQPSYIGNCPLTYLDTLTSAQEIELQQVVKDMIAQNVNTDIINCFGPDGEYKGGVYTFDLYGVTYYTTYNNLYEAYASNVISNNYIDAQYRLPYYNASYINTRIDQSGKALLETDGNNRFKTVRFENDSVTYTLTTEQTMDEAAYDDAMNKYYYDNAVYDKMVQDINARTSIIHQEDQELELRLKQLDTEQNALKTEMDAVQKVVKDNVDNTFKTFGG